MHYCGQEPPFYVEEMVMVFFISLPLLWLKSYTDHRIVLLLRTHVRCCFFDSI